MVLMRQRLLLVAGWIVAAVGAGVVASGAVAVAGGQVFDRPIRPLNAAEVAALPVDESVTALEPSVRLASGGSQARTGLIIEGCGRDTAGTSGSERPAGPGGAPALPFVFAGDSLQSRRILHVSGGSVVMTCVGEDVEIRWATPRPNYVVAFSLDEQTVTFTRDNHRSTISIARAPSGDLTIELDEQRIR